MLQGGEVAPYQNDPLAIEKLLQEPGGGYTEPKGGVVRWMEETLLKGNVAPLPLEHEEREQAERVARAWQQAVAAVPRAFTLQDDNGEGSAAASVGADGRRALGGMDGVGAQGVGGGGLSEVTGEGEGGRKWVTVGDRGQPIDEDEEDGEFKAAYKMAGSSGRVVPGFYPKGVVLHRDWRPSVGYEPVDTSAVDAARPAYQRELIQLADASERRQLKDKARKVALKAEREAPWREKEAAASSYSFTDYTKYQAAIKAVLRGRKWKQKLARGRNAPLPVG